MAGTWLPFRQIHLDFHTGPWIRDVGRDFDAEEFASVFAEAHVNSVTVFAKCHHGHLYYDTRHPARHPGLRKGLDLLGEQLEALHRRGIRAPIYLSVQCDEFAAREHPEWLALKPDGAPVSAGPFSAGWHIVDMSSPYQDYLADQLDEVLRKYAPVDEIFLDMCWDQPSSSKWAIDGMLREGLDPESEADRRRYSRLVVHRYMERYKRMIDRAHRGRAVPVWFNSRPLSNLVEEKKYLRHVEIEALPTGGWGYTYFPLNVRFVRVFGLPYLGMTARFHKSWADFGGLKPEAALLYECCQMLAHGARCSVGDQLHPRGTLDRAAYALIGKVYAHVERCESWCEGARTVAQIAVLRPAEEYHTRPGSASEGVVRALQELHHQFDILPPGAGLEGYELVIATESLVIDEKLRAALRRHLARGGSLLVSGRAALGADGRPALEELGIACEGESPFGTTYFRFERELSAAETGTDHVMYERGLRLRPARGAKVLARVVEPYFDRSWRHFSSHAQTPPDRVSPYAAAVERGRAITIAYPIFQAYATHGNLPFRRLLGACLARLLPRPLVRLDSPSFVEVTVTRQAKRTVVHLLGFCPQRRTPTLDIVEDIVPLRNLELSLAQDSAPGRVTTAPDVRELPFAHRDGRTYVVVPELRGHLMVVFE